MYPARPAPVKSFVIGSVRGINPREHDENLAVEERGSVANPEMFFRTEDRAGILAGEMLRIRGVALREQLLPSLGPGGS